jgi:hypothetical protein
LQRGAAPIFWSIDMLFTVSVDLADGGFFEFSTESILKFLQAAQALGNTDIEEVDDEDDEFDAFADCFVEGEEYEYDHDAGCYCWYDEEYEAWYWLDEDTNEWLLVEDDEADWGDVEDEAEEDEEELEAA